MIYQRHYGDHGPQVIVLHGGPAGPGSAAPIARGLADSFRVTEPWQRGSGQQPLSVARHVADLREVVESLGEPPALVGESWGAMLALAYAAVHPASVSRLALVGCGTFDTVARARYEALREERQTPQMKAAVAALEHEDLEAGEKIIRKYQIIGRFQHFDPLEPQPDADLPPFDHRAHQETWNDMLRLQADGTYPAAFTAITCPVLMLHGDYDPHPGALIRDSLRPHLPQLVYRELTCCGHCPWAERQAREAFFGVLRGWLRAA